MANVPTYGIEQQKVNNALSSLGGGATPNYTVNYAPAASTPSYGITQQDINGMANNLNSSSEQPSWNNLLAGFQSVPPGQNTNIGQQNILGGTAGYGIVPTQETINAAQNGDLKSRLALSINNRNINGTPQSWWEQAVDGVMNSGLVAGAKEMGSQVSDWLGSMWGSQEGGLNNVSNGGGSGSDAGGFMNQEFGGGTAMDWLGAGLQAFSIWNSYNLGKDQIANARDALNASKEQFNKNFAMAINSYNTQLEDRWRSRSMMETDTRLEDNAYYLNELNSQQLNSSGNRNGGGYTHDAQREAVAEKQKTDSQIAQEQQMRQYRENEAAQAIMSAKNMEDILARSRAAAEAGATAYNPEGMKNLALLANTQLIANNQAAEERVQREFGDYQARITQARNNGDRALENKLLNEYVAKRNQASQESGLDYNQLNFGRYDYQANDSKQMICSELILVCSVSVCVGRCTKALPKK